MTDNQWSMMLHALGLPSRPGYHNHYCAAVGGTNYWEWRALVDEGLATMGAKINEGQDVYFHVSPEGQRQLVQTEAALVSSPALTDGQNPQREASGIEPAPSPVAARRDCPTGEGHEDNGAGECTNCGALRP